MRSTFMGIHTALSGITTYQKSIDITGHNLTNLYTEGYTRQRADVVSNSLAGMSRYDVNGGKLLAGQGSSISGIEQIRDPFLDKRFRDEYATVAYHDATASVLDDIEATLDELGETGIKKSFEDILSALKSFSTNPDQETNATIVKNAMLQLTQTIQQFDAKLVEIHDQQKFDLDIAVKDLNSITERIAVLNEAIADANIQNSVSMGPTYGPNELLDERNLLLDQLAYYGEIKVDEVENGVVNVEMAGVTIIDGYETNPLVYAETYTGDVTMTWGSDNSNLATVGGSLKAIADMINGAGPNPANPDQNFEQGVPYYRDKLDELAATFAEAFNNVIPLDGGGFKTLFHSTDGGDITASTMSLVDDWHNNSAYIMQGVDTDGELDNGYILSMIELFDNPQSFSEYEGSFDGFVTFINTQIGQQKVFNTSRLEATAAVADDMLDRRDAISAVSQDEEAANLMMYEKAYQAVARVMTTMDEALNTIINGMGLVGR